MEKPLEGCKNIQTKEKGKVTFVQLHLEGSHLARHATDPIDAL